MTSFDDYLKTVTTCKIGTLTAEQLHVIIREGAVGVDIKPPDVYVQPAL